MLVHALLFILAQAGKPGGASGGDMGGCLGAALACVCPLLIFLVFIVPMIAGMWKAFAKAGEPGVAALVPIWNTIVLLKIAGQEPIRVLFWMIPFANIYFVIVDTIDFAKAYGKEAGFGLGLAFLPMIFWPILGFGSARYLGAPTGGVKRRAARYEDEEEEEEPRPRRQRRPADDY
jgi:hypothetical protein